MGSQDHDREWMIDIVERLENMWMEQEPKLLWTDMEAITEEAAEEIIRLRAENETLRRDVKTAVMGDSAELADVKRENEKLKAILIELADEYEQFAYEGAEIALLREARAAAAIRESDNGDI